MQNLFLVGNGPSLKTWPRCEPHWMHVTSVLMRPGWDMRSSRFAPTAQAEGKEQDSGRNEQKTEPKTKRNRREFWWRFTKRGRTKKMWQEAGRGGEKMKRKQVTLASRKEQVTNNPKKKSKHTFRVSAQDFAVSGKYTSARGRVRGGGRRARWLVAHSNIQVRWIQNKKLTTIVKVFLV